MSTARSVNQLVASLDARKEQIQGLVDTFADATTVLASERQGIRTFLSSLVTLTDDYRRGLLGKGSLLLLTSYSTRTSPVLRGKYILANLLGDEPPPPPKSRNRCRR